jgi:FkbM family methyltransferase
MRYSQNKEQDYIVNYFAGKTGKLLDIGANDGKTFSNSLALIELGWAAVLVEPSPSAYTKLRELHKENDKVMCLRVAIGNKQGTTWLHDMGEHVGNGDTSLLSTTIASEKDRWPGTAFKRVKVDVIPYEDIIDDYDFITIDAEGLDIDILKQINLDNTRMVCIEWNNIPANEAAIRAIMPPRFREIYRSLENLIYAI